MDPDVLFGLLDFGSGALVACIAIGLVISYRAWGGINLAAGALAMFAGYAFWALDSGALGKAFAPPVSVPVALTATVAAGCSLEWLVFRPLRGATSLSKFAATLGVVLLLRAVLELAFGELPKQERSLLPRGSLQIGGVFVPTGHLVLGGAVLGLAACVAALYRWTRFGLATRAAAESETSAELAGLSPGGLSLGSTVLTSLVLGFAGVFAAPVKGLGPSLPLEVVPALTAAVFASFSSVGVACLAAFAITVMESLVAHAATLSWFPKDYGALFPGIPLPGIRELLVFALLATALTWRGARIPQRGERAELRLPAVPRSSDGRFATPAAVGLAGLLIFLPYDFRQALVNSLIAAVLALSLVIITGFLGQVSAMQLALSGVAGLVISHLGTSVGLTFPVAPLAGAVAATLLGLIVGAIAFRVRGSHLAVATLAAAVVVEEFGFGSATWGAAERGARVPQPTLLGLHLGSDGPFRGIDGLFPSPVLGLLILAVAVPLGLVVLRLPRTQLGRQMLAIRSNERAAAAAGINVRGIKLAGFGLGSCIAGIAGAMYAYNFGSVSATRFGAFEALAVIAFVYVGGITMVSGAVIAGLLSTQGLVQHALDAWFGISGNWILVFGGTIVLIVLTRYPDGAAGAIAAARRTRWDPVARWNAAGGVRGRV